MAKAKALPNMDADTLYSAFLQCDEYAGTDKKMLRENFNALIEVMGLSVAKLCRCANYDPSAIFRFRRGERQPAEPEQFARRRGVLCFPGDGRPRPAGSGPPRAGLCR